MLTLEGAGEGTYDHTIRNHGSLAQIVLGSLDISSIIEENQACIL